MKCKVITKCLNSGREFLEANSIVEVDPKKDKKLFDLGLVRKYDEKLDKNTPIDETTALKAKVAELEGFVEEAIGLPKGQKPADYKKDA